MPLAANATAVSKDECREFMSVFPGNLHHNWKFALVMTNLNTFKRSPRYADQEIRLIR